MTRRDQPGVDLVMQLINKAHLPELPMVTREIWAGSDNSVWWSLYTQTRDPNTGKVHGTRGQFFRGDPRQTLVMGEKQNGR